MMTKPSNGYIKGHMNIDGDKYTATCPHYSVTAERTHDPTIPETQEFMIRYALQRHSSECQKPCMLDIWNEWFAARRDRFIAAGNANAHG